MAPLGLLQVAYPHEMLSIAGGADSKFWYQTMGAFGDLHQNESGPIRPKIELQRALDLGTMTNIRDIVEQLAALSARLRNGNLTCYVTCYECFGLVLRNRGALRDYGAQKHGLKYGDTLTYDCVDHELFFYSRAALNRHIKEEH